jgi:hypothetical protein
MNTNVNSREQGSCECEKSAGGCAQRAAASCSCGEGCPCDADGNCDCGGGCDCAAAE